MSIEAFHFILFALAVFRITHLIIYDKITEFIRRVFIEFEEEVDEDGSLETFLIIADKGWKKWMGELFSCHWCMGIWVSFFLWGGHSLLPNVFSIVIFVFAAAGIASILDSIVLKWL
ncbi:DUF1360 domain-containing protein [Evansella sp. AB-P1]|uniref:DUF1360 domain-containing protein n=1 Tax=Evansella sp. AB-P1 TaxID=3037653 RepID=UPI00241D4166|nr:DUF1360 domain-containing protein [Evansella sp. AB-P1]MDG5789120.1 DUF1360 domain-containing protein [Evansella sp. AB-P1]